MSEFIEVGGVEWCVTHEGIVDECSDQNVIEIEDEETGGIVEHIRCDMAEVSGPPTCVIVTLYHKAVQS